MAASESVAVGDEAAAGAEAEPEPEGACGWSKPQSALELTCQVQMDGVRKL